ncbi:MAG: hypothetical protein AABX79_01070 [Nanoarchaeota archaeon]
MAERANVVIAILILIIVVLAGIMVYAFIIKPKITGYNVQRQTEGATIALSQILNVVAKCQAFPVPVGNQTITLVALECLQQSQETSPAQ